MLGTALLKFGLEEIDDYRNSVIEFLVALLDIIGGLFLIFGLFVRYTSLPLAIQSFAILLYGIWEMQYRELKLLSVDSVSNLILVSGILILLSHGGGRISLERLMKHLAPWM